MKRPLYHVVFIMHDKTQFEIEMKLLMKKKLRGLSPQANYTERATAASR